MFRIIKIIGISVAYLLIANLGLNAVTISNDAPMDIPTITTNPVLIEFCSGDKLNVSFIVSSDFLPENIFSVQLSDGQGDFSNPTVIGTLNSVTSGSILASLPKNLPNGFGYRVRVVGSIPASTGTDNGQNITINELPAMNIDGNFEPCTGDVSIYNTKGEVGFYYTWLVTGGDIQGNNNTTSLYVLWGTDSVGTLQLIKRNGITNCTDTLIINVDIKSKPLTNIAWGEYEVCAGEIIEYLAGGGSVATDNWLVQGGTILYSDASKARVRWDYAGEGWIEMQKTSAFGCKGKDRRVVTINPVPVAQIYGNNKAYSEKRTLYKSIPEPGTGNWWQVRGGTKQDSTADSVYITWGQAGTGWLRLVKYYKSTDCSDTAELNITINPGIPLGEIEGKEVVCSGKTESYSTDTVDNTYIRWFVQGGSIIGANNGFNINVGWVTAGTGEVKYVITEFDSGNKDSLALSVMINPTPVISFPLLLDVCINNGPFLLDLGQPVGGAYSGDGVDMDYFYPDRGGVGTHEITYSYTNQQGCEGTQTRTIIVNPKPEKPVITFTDSGFVSSYDYGNQWFESGYPINGANDKELKNPDSGWFTVQFTDSNGCKSDMSDGVEVPVEEYSKVDGINVYPNPAGDFLVFDDKTSKMLRKIEIVDLIGNSIYSKDNHLSFVEIIQRLDISKIPNGFYIIKLYISDCVIAEKLIISR